MTKHKQTKGQEMISAKFNSWFSEWFFGNAGCIVETDADVTYTFIFNTDRGVIGTAKTGGWK